MADLRSTVKIGAHRVLWTPDGGSETDLGFTEDGVVIEIEQSKAERRVHEVTAPFGAVEDEANITCDVVLKEANLDTVAVAIGALRTTDAGPPEIEVLEISPQRGAEASFGKLVFRPRDKDGVGGTDLSEDKTIFNAIVLGDSSRPFQANADQTVTLSVKAGLYWDSTLSKYRLYAEGDPTAGAGFEL